MSSGWPGYFLLPVTILLTRIHVRRGKTQKGIYPVFYKAASVQQVPSGRIVRLRCPSCCAHEIVAGNNGAGSNRPLFCWGGPGVCHPTSLPCGVRGSPPTRPHSWRACADDHDASAFRSPQLLRQQPRQQGRAQAAQPRQPHSKVNQRAQLADFVSFGFFPWVSFT